ncbi:YdcF family protein [Daejeonella sp.]|uniref:YdcF family protein n=1 Tax=Daejeonella sp. TaxID=2805397 RepID=UPI0030BADDF0
MTRNSPDKITEEDKLLAKQLWEYHHVNHTIQKSDCILVLGSHDTRVADRGAELYLQGLAPVLIFSGGLGNFTQGVWDESEADKFAKIAISLGVPIDAILIENRSTNTGENIMFTQQLLKEKGMDPESFIVVQKPYMERRSYATFKKHWPDKSLYVTSPQISFDDYPTAEISLGKVISIMVGDLQRIRMYPEKGYQVYQEIPDEVWEAYESLVDRGYDGHLM